MTCNDYLFIFDDYDTDELEAGKRAAISDHLAVCESCADFYEAFRRQEHAVEQYLLRAQASPALWTNLQTAIRNEKVVPPQSQTRTKSGKFKSVFSNFNLIFSPRGLVFSALAVIIAGTLFFLLVGITITRRSTRKTIRKCRPLLG
jgi:anti-sigma factor RsiW